ncbi:MAG TPA: glycosyltransferase N-terminal domain-containing protein [Thermoanaerobaculia bacterium]|nr:glycosyltransferase N-terminal domain-containing protein [Thermoanaerobaculia bacterium]
MWLLYQLGVACALALAGPWLLVRRGSHYLPTLRHRLGGYPAGRPERPLWIHAVSVGEVGVAGTLAAALPADLPLLVTTITPTGQQRARAQLSHRAQTAYLPFDLTPPIARFFSRFRPAALVLVEGDYWPLLLRRCRRQGVPVAVVNGRVGDRSFRRLARLPAALRRPLLAPIAAFGVQTAEDARRLGALGVAPERVRVTGNLKYEAPEPPRQPQLEVALAAAAAGRPILVAGSTMPGEEEAVLSAFATLGGGERALLLLAPRHPERWEAVAATLDASGLPWARRSVLEGGAGTSVVLLDSLGELAALYRLAAATFIGGTLARSGGHNPLEPARFGRPIAVGPSMENFRDMAEQFDRAGAWQRVADAGELAAVWRRWLDDPPAAAAVGAAALQLVESNRGALASTRELLVPLVAAATR